MAEFRRVSADYSVAPQLTPADVTAAAALGFRTIVANRPDGEAAGQPTLGEIEAAATAAGLRFVRIPIGGAPTAEAVAATADVMAGPGPVLAYCRSGTRSATLWALAAAQTGRMAPDAILAAAEAAGYNLSSHAGSLRRLSGS